jgi:predicted nucleic acid-binding protein
VIAVFDASVLAKLFLAEALSTEALDAVTQAHLVLVPDIAILEVASAITRACRNQHITERAAQNKLSEWQEFQALSNVQQVPFATLLADAQALSLTLKHALTDCVYLALALQRNAVLITADAPLCNAAAPTYPVRHLAAGTVSFVNH